MPDQSSISVSVLTHVIFRYHLPLRGHKTVETWVFLIFCLLMEGSERLNNLRIWIRNTVRHDASTVAKASMVKNISDLYKMLWKNLSKLWLIISKCLAGLFVFLCTINVQTIMSRMLRSHRQNLITQVTKYGTYIQCIEYHSVCPLVGH